MENIRTIICNEYQKERIYHSLSLHNDSASLAGVRLVSPGVLLRFEAEEDRYASMMVFAGMLKEHQNSFTVYKDMLKYPAFLQEMLSFARECALYGITAEDLPHGTKSETELAMIIDTALQMPLEEISIHRNYGELVRKAQTMKPEFALSFETDIFRKRFLDTLKAGAESSGIIGRETEAKTEHLRYALSTRQEIEAAAQEICASGTPCNVILTDRQTQMPVLEQVFRRYGIPFSPVEDHAFPQTVHVFLALAEFAMDKDAGSFLQILKTNGFSVNISSDLIPFAERLMTDPSYDPDIYLNIQHEDFSNEKDKTRDLGTRLSEYLKSVSEETDFLLDAKDPAEALKCAYTLLQKHPLMLEAAQLKAGIGIRSVLSQTLNYVHTREDADLVLSMIENIPVTYSDMTTDFCTVTDLTHPADAAKTTYILGCSAKSYPGVPARKGVFDENYVAKVPGYPSLEERHESYMTQLSWIRHSGETLVWSYATNDYQGRNIEPAFEITGRLSAKNIKPVPWKPVSLRPARTPEHALDTDTAEALFTRQDGKIHGSISRFERWYQCPYSYFIESGLSIRQFDTPSLDSATIGTIQHAFMEEMVRSYGKDYTEVTKSEIHDFLKPWFDDLKIMRPHDTWQIDLTMERMCEGLYRSLLFLSEAEKNTVYRPYDLEHQFTFDITDGITLNGIIDRIDTSGDSFRIIDYKSSVHKLSETSVKAGIQLQLLSYVFAAEHLLKKTPTGACYFSMQSKAVSEKAGSFKTKGITLQDDVTDEALLKETSDSERKFSGWSFPQNEDDDLFSSYFSMPVYDLEKVRQCITELYDFFREHLLAGEIQVDPLDTACMFCLNAAVCRNTRGTRKSKPVVMADEKLKPGKGDQS